MSAAYAISKSVANIEEFIEKPTRRQRLKQLATENQVTLQKLLVIFLVPAETDASMDAHLKVETDQSVDTLDMPRRSHCINTNL